jgi:5'-deoxynucleotidase YfbR-like HD superfamily hydrolase
MRWEGLSSLRLEFKEPYPIYRGLRVPVWEGGRPVRVRRVTDEDRRAFADAMRKLRSLLVKASNVARASGLNEVERFNLLADTIVAFLKAPLIREATPAAPTPLKAYALLLLARVVRRLWWSEDLYEFAEKLAELKEGDLGFAEELFQPETADLVFKLWVAFPADTRPGHNTSSLIAHLLMTSAIAWALRRARGEAKEDEAARIRLAALLHDLGKVVDPERHYEASEGLAKALLKDLVEERTLEAVATTIREHHREAEPSWALNQADRLASAADRLEKLVERTLGDKLSKAEGLLRRRRDEGWAFWRAVHERRRELVKAGLAAEDPLRELTEEFLTKVDEAAGEPESRKGEPSAWLSLVLVDVASIQDLVMSSQEVRVMAAASHLIDLAVHAHFLEYLRNNGLYVPPEAVIYAGGGNILMLLPEVLTSKVEELARRYGEKNELKLVVASAPFYDNYVAAYMRLAKGMFGRKHMLEPSDELGCSEGRGRDLCRMCYGNWAEANVDTREGSLSVCNRCKRLYEAGSKHHFGPKWQATIRIVGDTFTAKEAFAAEWEGASQWIVEVIAGHHPKEFHKREVERIRDYAVIKFDGNAVGSFMSEAISFTDAIERSFRIDVALKRAYFKALEALYEGVRDAAGVESARMEVARVALGTIYMGGDDGFILAPSWASALLAHFIAEEFSRQLGLERGLRVAVAAGQARMSVWALLDCAREMMNKAGDVIRKEDPTAAERVLGAVAFDVFESGSPSGASAVERMQRLSRRMQRLFKKAEGSAEPLGEGVDGLQPYLIRRQDLEGSTVPELWGKLVPLVLDLPPRSTWSDVEAYHAYVEAFAKAYLMSRSKAEEKKMDRSEAQKEALRSVRNAILRSWSVVSGSRYWREKLLVYLQRQEERRLERAMEEAYRRLAQFTASSLSSDGMGPVPLADALTLIKLVKGGAW